MQYRELQGFKLVCLLLHVHRHRDIYIGSFYYLRTVMSRLATAMPLVWTVDGMG